MATLTELQKQALERRRIAEIQSKNLPIVGQLDAEGDRIGLLSAMFGTRPAINQGIIDPNVSVNDPALFNIYPQIRGSQGIGKSGLISDANAGSSMPVMQPAMQTNRQIPMQQPTNSNIFGDVLGTVFPGIDQSNKQLINAAILQGSLELLKPRQPSEGLAGQFGRAITAGQKVGTDLQKQELENLVAGVGLQKTAAEINKLQREAKEGKQVNVTKSKIKAFENIIDPLYDSNPSFAADIELLKQRTNDSGNLNPDTRSALQLEAMAIGGNPSEAIQQAVKNYLSGSLVSNQNQTSTQTGVDPYAQAGR
jgi:hypothetical protein